MYEWNPVYIIFMDKIPMFVWIGDIKGAEKKRDKLAKEYWERNIGGYKNYAAYKRKCLWWVYDVNSNDVQSPQG
jgi:hypothetical protein